MLLLVIGGSASGKSEYAEERAVLAGGRRYYVAAMKPFGEEAEKRIARHRALRAGKGFETIERYTDLEGLCRERPDLAGQTVLVECLSNLTANEMFEPEGAGLSGGEEAIVSGIHSLSEMAETVIVVSADAFGEGRLSEAEEESVQKESADLTGRYVRILGRIHARLAQMADEVVEVVYSIPVKQKG